MSLTAEELQIMPDKFDMADTDHSGGLDMSELRAFLEGQGEDVSELYALYDGNQDGILEFEEFVVYLMDSMKRTTAWCCSIDSVQSTSTPTESSTPARSCSSSTAAAT
jgi:hypothetical protein